MASTYTPLGIELMATGENAGTWGTKTNTNLQIFEQIAGGYASVTVNGTGATALSISDGATGANGAARVIILTGTITGNITVTLPLDVENFYAIKNATTGSFTVEFKYVTGTGTSFTWSATQKDWRLFTAKADDATNPNIEEISLTTAPAGSDTQIQFNNSGSFGGSANLVWDGTDIIAGSAKVSDLTSGRVVTAGTSGAIEDSANLTFDGSNLTIDAEGALRLGDNAGNAYVGLQAPTTITGDTAYTLKLPVATGAADTFIKTDGSGNLSFAAISGGAAWQAVITADPANAVAGNGYFCNTTSAAFTVTLPTSASIGDFISFIDYAGTFDTNNLTIGRNGHNIQGSATDLVVGVERAGFTLVYVDSTQGWLLQNN